MPDETTPNRRSFLARTVAAGASLATLGLHAQTAEWPTGPVRLVLGVPPGGGTDVVARMLGQKLAAALGQPVVVDNKPGAGQTIGAAFVARAPADGHTLLFCTQTLAANPSIYPNLPYDTARDFVPVAFVARLPYAVFINGRIPANNLQEFIALAKAKPGEYTFASAGASSLPRIAGEMFKLRTGTELLHVPYNGTAPAVQSVVAGQTHMWIGNFLTMEGHLESGRLKALAVASEQRFPNAPNVPTVAEAGVPGLHLAAWYGIMARTGTPPAVVARLNQEVNKALGDPEVKERLVRDGAEPGKAGTPQQFGAFLKTEMDQFRDVARRANITP
ncbi:MAG TPA: tripartite tricarboxylate transporter substrate binding protein [Ramlibacter sp.]|nr:tripartite tricarboxylate transporter substrate binding protein [Ramlibacter sp.]